MEFESLNIYIEKLELGRGKQLLLQVIERFQEVRVQEIGVPLSVFQIRDGSRVKNPTATAT